MAKTRAGRLVMASGEELGQKEAYICPACQQAVVLKSGSVMRPHFAHRRLADCQFWVENESDQHLGLKARLFKTLSEHEISVEVERVLVDLGQVADLFVGERLALEVQCSRLSKERLRERTRAYQDAGYQVRWLLGRELWLGKRMTALQKDFLYFSSMVGFHLWELDIDQDCIRLKFMIYEDIFGRLYYQTKSWSLNDDLLAILRQPYQKTLLSTYEVTQVAGVGRRIQRELLAKHPRWLKRQEEAYRKGKNLVVLEDQAFYPQVRFLEAEDGFAQVTQDLAPFQEAFEAYYRQQGFSLCQTLYPPAFYATIRKKKDT